MTFLPAALRRRARPALAFWLVPTLVVLSLAVILGPAKAAGPCDPPIANPVACENTKPGTPESVWDVGQGSLTIQGFATEFSRNKGETVRFKIKTNANNYTVKIFRLGWYQGNGARQVATVTPSASLPQNQPACNREASTLLIDCGNWAESASWAIPSDAVSGVYFALITRTDTGADSHIPFVVRDDASTSDLLFQTADTTWQAYNRYSDVTNEEISLYVADTAPGRAYKVSYNRPFITRRCCAEDFVFSMEYPMIRFLERNGYDLSYSSGIDTDRRGDLIRNHKVFTATGHDEYWSKAARDNLEAARDAGVHIAMFTGNDIYWKTRWEPGLDGTPYRTLVTYKETRAHAKIDPTPTWTGTWRDPRFSPPSDGGRPENALLGNMYLVDCCAVALKVPAADGKMRFWRNTPVASQAAGATMTLADNTVGYEWNVDADNGFRPPGLIRMSTTTATHSASNPVLVLQDYGSFTEPGTATHHLTLYRHASGALVFGAGTIQWSWGLDEAGDDARDQGRPPVNQSMRQATVNLLADMGVQPDTLMAGLTQAGPSTDTTAADTAITGPAAGSSYQVGQQVTITGTASDAGGGQVGGVEVSTDNGQTWHPATGRETWTYTWSASGVGDVTIRARAVDDSGNLDATPASRNVTVACPCTIFPDNATPAVPADSDPNSIELGVKFRADRSGFVTGVRFWKGSGNTGTHTGSLWSVDGTQLATATFSSETSTGWQQVSFDAPVPIAANTTYVASYHAPNGHYAYTAGAFGTDVSNPPLRALKSGTDGGNGVFRYGSGSVFPTQSFNDANYWVDVVFTTDGGPPDTTPPTVVDKTPAAGATDVPTGANVTMTFNEQVAPLSINLTLKQGTTTVPAAVTYSSSSRTVTLNPDANLDADKTYTATLSHAEDLAGNPIAAPVSWSFTTKGAACPCSIWDTTTVPAVAASGDTGAVELGVKFRTDADGWITGLRFYKGTGNSGVHVGSLWTAGGTRLAVATFTGETASGWQQVAFDNPVPVTSGTTYIASYHAPAGHYAFNANYFTAQAGESPVRALANGTDGGNGVYRYTTTPSSFPSSSYNASNYWVDVVFTATAPPADTTPPTVTAKVPAAGATDVAATTNVTATFNEQVAEASLSLTLKTAGGAVVPGTVGYDSISRSATLNPDSSLVAGGTYTASVTARDLAGNEMPSPETWSFTVKAANCPCTVWDASATPEATANDASELELGVKIRPDVDGTITGVRFYKAAGNTGTHTGSLWSASGTRLATATFTGETSGGWQQVTFSSPVPVTAGTTYVVSYFAPDGHYSYTRDYFATQGAGPGPIRALRSGVDGANGVFRYAAGGGFPTSSFRDTNYWVDAVFQPSP